MDEFPVIVSEQNQITVPPEVRRELGVEPLGLVRFVMKEGHVYLTSVSSSLESTYGSLPPSVRTKDLKEITNIAKVDKADRTVREMRGES